MKKVQVVIGSNYGDEGKGLWTDYLAAEAVGRACVIRFNGGAQAGHTVELVDGRRHVFSHIGSGTLAGLPTYLSSFFVCHPIIFLREYLQLVDLGVHPLVYADPACAVTTPYDMMINQIIEQARGASRHGSVGLGFGETIERQNDPAFVLTMADIGDRAGLRKKLDSIRAIWVPHRLAQLGLTSISIDWHERLDSDILRDRFIDDCAAMLDKVIMAPLPVVQRYDHLIFEGAQGLLLDQHRGSFPYVTRSNTGLKNVVALGQRLGVTDMDVYYLTRSYLTRHGAGPMPYHWFAY